MPALCVVLFAPSTQVSAQIPASGDPPVEYDGVIIRAIDEFGAGRYTEASILFERAHAMYPNARTLRGLGMTIFELRDYPRAWVALHDALEHAVRPLTPEQRAEVESLLARAEQFVAFCTVASVPDGARVTVDGEDALVAGSTLVLSPGEHEIAIEGARGQRLVRSVVGVAGGTIRCELSEFEDTAADPVSPAPNKLHTHLLVGAGGGALALGLGAFYWANRATTLRTCRDAIAEGLTCGNEGALARQRNAGMGVTIVSGIGAAALLVSGLLVPEHSRDAALVCAPTGVGVACAGAF